jgi:hypothetical protein
MKSPRTPNRPNILLRLLGPGLVTGAADDDPSGIPTYSNPERNLGMACCGRSSLTTPFMIAAMDEALSIRNDLGSDLMVNIAHSSK